MITRNEIPGMGERYSSFVIPAIDIMEGRCVRLSRGDYRQRTTYAEKPLEVAKRLQAAGFRRLHLVDLEGARLGQVTNWAVLETLASHTSLAIDFSGGVRSEQDIRRVFDAGASWVCIGSLAQSDPEKTTAWLHQYGGERLIIAVDTRDEHVAIQGWQRDTRTTIYALIETYLPLLRHVMCTDISRDGMMEGPGLPLYRKLKERFPELHIIASGGVHTLSDVEQLAAIGLSGVIVGKALY